MAHIKMTLNFYWGRRLSRWETSLCKWSDLLCAYLSVSETDRCPSSSL